jgi:copper chaperone CopZ
MPRLVCAGSGRVWFRRLSALCWGQNTVRLAKGWVRRLAGIAVGSLVGVAAADPLPVTRTLYVSGLECGGCTYLVQQALSETKGVSAVAVEVVPSADNYVLVTFDATRLSEQRLAHLVREALPLHGTPYVATLRLRFSQLDRDWPLVESVMERWQGRARLEKLDSGGGQVAVHFGVPSPQEKGAVSLEWSVGAFREALNSRGAEGRAVSFEVVQEKAGGR